MRYKVVRHKKGWAVEEHYDGMLTGKTVIDIKKTKAEAQAIADEKGGKK